MPLEEFLLPKESIKYIGTEEVEYQGSTYNLYLTNIRLILHIRKGLVFKKERIISERLLEIPNVHYNERDMMKGILGVVTSRRKMNIIGSRDYIKEVLKELKKYKKLAEENAGASLYMENWLVSNESFARSLARMVWEKANNCCVCGSEKVRFWILNGANMKNGIVILARLFCREHEKRWKNGEMLDYEKFNGLMLLEKTCQKPVGMWTDISQSKFLELMKAPMGDDYYARQLRAHTISMDFFEYFLTKSSDLILKGKIDEFLE